MGLGPGTNLDSCSFLNKLLCFLLIRRDKLPCPNHVPTRTRRDKRGCPSQIPCVQPHELFGTRIHPRWGVPPRETNEP